MSGIVSIGDVPTPPRAEVDEPEMPTLEEALDYLIATGERVCQTNKAWDEAATRERVLGLEVSDLFRAFQLAKAEYETASGDVIRAIGT